MGLASLRDEEERAHTRLMAVRERLAVAVAVARDIPRLERELEAFDMHPPVSNSEAYRAPAPDGTTELRQKLAAARRERATREALRIEETELMRVLEQTRSSLEQHGIRKVTLALLDAVSVATPCPASWEAMEGDGDVRFCTQCKKDVFNLSMMTREEAEAVLKSAMAKGEACVRFYRREDGTLLTQDCPVGVRQRRFWRRTVGIAAAGILVCIGTLMYAQLVNRVQCAGQSAVMGGIH
jgi:hypothetical protein